MNKKVEVMKNDETSSGGGGILENRKSLYFLIILLITVTMGISYAIWQISYHQKGINKIVSSCFSLEITSEENDINLTGAYPISDAKGKELTPYTFTVKNTCELFASYDIILGISNENDLEAQYIKAQLDSDVITLKGMETTNIKIEEDPNYTKGYLLGKGSLGSEEEQEYTLRLWMSEDTPANSSTMKKNFTSKIVIVGQPSTYSPVNEGYTKLSEAMLANEYQSTPAIAKNKIAAKGTPDFSKTAPEIIWQENRESGTVTVNADKPHEDINGSYTLSGELGVKNENQYVALGKASNGNKGYTFNSANGTYALSNVQIVDPTTIEDYGMVDYYFCNGGTSVTSNGNLTANNTISSCTYIYKVNSVEESAIGQKNTNSYRRRYTFQGTRLSQVELESDKSDKGLYQAQDDYGTSYYYRGNVRNNYVKFGDGIYRIIRQNGDGTVRMIYNGQTTNQEYSVPVQQFNLSYNNPTYVGYKYGNPDGGTKEEVQTNTTDSTIKDYLEDTWYKSEIEDKNLSTYITDEIFCNDQSVKSGSGFGTSQTTLYGAYDRLISKKSPVLTCAQDNDKFTVSSGKGNQQLEKPVGLITADELAMAGAVNGYLNRLFYLYTGQTYWTMSPYAFDAYYGIVYEWVFTTTSDLGRDWVVGSNGVRPVINLKENVEIESGVGTATDPYIIKLTN